MTRRLPSHRAQRAARTLAGASLLAALVACGGGGVSVVETGPPTAPGGAPDGAWRWDLPAGLPVPAVPADNPMNTAKVELGRFLFYDKRLSGNGTQACAGCHVQEKAFTDGLAVSIGSTGQAHPRNAQPLANVAYAPTLTWANPSLITLEKQMETPLFGERPVEMGVHDGNKAAVLQRIADDAQYPPRFAAAFAGEAAPLHWGNVIKAIAAFQRSIVSAGSRYDQFVAGRAALQPNELRGMQLFFGEKAECFHCHGSPNFNDQFVHATTRVLETPFHNTGLFNIGGTGAFPEPNRGVFELSGKPSDMGKFRAQSLRNIALTAPYMHDGSIATLEAVLDFYAAGGRNIESGPHAGDGRRSPLKSDFVSRIDLDAQEKSDLVAFLKTLTDHDLISNPKFADPFKK